MIILSILLFLSVILNGLLVWYAIKAIQKIRFVTESMEIINLDLEIFSKHLKGIYELEIFYR